MRPDDGPVQGPKHVVLAINTTPMLVVFRLHYPLPSYYIAEHLLMCAVIKLYEGHLESKERFAIKKCLLITGKKKNMQVLSHTFTYFST